MTGEKYKIILVFYSKYIIYNITSPWNCLVDEILTLVCSNSPSKISVLQSVSLSAIKSEDEVV